MRDDDVIDEKYFVGVRVLATDTNQNIGLPLVAQTIETRIVEYRALVRRRVQMDAANLIIRTELQSIDASKQNRCSIVFAAQHLPRRETHGTCVGKAAADSDLLDAGVFGCGEEFVWSGDDVFVRGHERSPWLRGHSFPTIFLVCKYKLLSSVENELGVVRRRDSAFVSNGMAKLSTPVKITYQRGSVLQKR